MVRPRPGEPIVDRRDVLEALEDMESVLYVAGGGFTVITQRVRAEDVLVDGLPQEAFTQAVVFEWTDRTDARPAPERTVPPAAQLPVESPAPTSDDAGLHDVPDSLPADAPLVDPGGVGDGLVVTAEEDLSSIPPALR